MTVDSGIFSYVYKMTIFRGKINFLEMDELKIYFEEALK